MRDGELPALLNNDDARQILHITYGLILNAVKDGRPLFKTALYKALHEFEQDYYDGLSAHLKRHIEALFN